MKATIWYLYDIYAIDESEMPRVSEELWCILSKCVRLLKTKAKTIWMWGPSLLSPVSLDSRWERKWKIERGRQEQIRGLILHESGWRLILKGCSAGLVCLWRLSLHTWGHSPALWVSRVRDNEKEKERRWACVLKALRMKRMYVFVLLLTWHCGWLLFKSLNALTLYHFIFFCEDNL